MSLKSPSQFKILNDTLDLMTLMTHTIACLLQTELLLYHQNLSFVKNDKIMWQKFGGLNIFV